MSNKQFLKESFVKILQEHWSDRYQPKSSHEEQEERDADYISDSMRTAKEHHEEQAAHHKTMEEYHTKKSEDARASGNHELADAHEEAAGWHNEANWQHEHAHKKIHKMHSWEITKRVRDAEEDENPPHEGYFKDHEADETSKDADIASKHAESLEKKK